MTRTCGTFLAEKISSNRNLLSLNIIKVHNQYRWEACPLCGSSRAKKIGRLNYEGLVQFSNLYIELSLIPELWGCEECRSKFVQNSIEEDVAKILYTQGESADRWSRQPFEHSRTQAVVMGIRGFLKRGVRVLDVGANTGEFLDFAKDFECKTSGLEYSENSRSVLTEKGHLALSSFTKANEPYDLISAFDLVEHLYDVPGFLRLCHGLLTENGHLAILTGDINSRSALTAGPNWWYAQYPEHIVFPSCEFLSNLPNYKVELLSRTHASVGYQMSPLLGIFQFLRRRLQGRGYSGLPSLGKDHIFAVLKKA